ncbi:MobF family relaxase [Phycicoccus sonneratiae]|nr:MobF family relaxase [Phycicoccus sonneraticus]
MSLHKLTAGTGYTYLTRQVAAQDRTSGARQPLASYYTEKGETPGRWVGSGMAGIDGLSIGDEVTAQQMQALFGAGLHPLANQRADRLEGPDLTDRDLRAVTRLGLPFAVTSPDVTAFQVEVARRIEDRAASLGHPRDYPVPAADRARIRSQVAVEMFHGEHGRDPKDARELSAAIAKLTRSRTAAVAGYDLTFSPVKSVSTLWAIAPPEVAAQVEQAHNDAVTDALAFIEKHALYTREGKRGVRQVDVTGLVATAFTHRDSRAGDPDLHTHIAVANKVQTLSGKWLSIDGRVLFKATVLASEAYNTALETHLRTRLGLVFAERPGTDRTKRPIREVVGVDPRLNRRWSSRRASIEHRRAQLAAAFQADHGRPPTTIEAIHLAQQATLETRDGKHEPRTLAEQREAWREQAEEVLGGSYAVHAMVTKALTAPRPASSVRVDEAWVADTADVVRDTLQATRATWQTWHVRAEALRRVRAANLPAEQVETAVDQVTEHALNVSSVRLTAVSDGIEEPAELRRVDGSSMYEVAGSATYTSTAVLAAEQQLVEAAGIHDRHQARPEAVTLALLEQAANGTTLNPGQASLVTAMATSGACLQLALAPAGSGKTTAMRTLAAAWVEDGGTVLGLAPSAAAAAVLREQIDAHTETLAKLTWSITHDDLPDWASSVGFRTLVVIDEAGMADTLSLAAVVDFVVARGGQVRLVGDTQQLAAIGAGGVLSDIASTHGAAHLSELVRFVDPAQAAASLALRDGKVEALGFYLDHDRVHVGDLTTCTENLFTAWATDRAHGVDAIMLAPTRELVGQLNHRAQAHRLNGITPGQGVALADGNTAFVGERITTRSNDRRLRLGANDWVKNGDRWTVQAVSSNGSLVAEHSRTHRQVTLPADYVATSTELGYASTVHGAQGVSVDTMHGLATGTETRQQLYTMLTRGAVANHVHVAVVGDGDPHDVIRPESIHPPTAADLLEGILTRDDTPTSATTLLHEQDTPAPRLADAVARYVDALHVAAEHHLGPHAVAALEKATMDLVPGVEEDPAWPILRSHLILLAAAGTDPRAALQQAVTGRELDTAGDRAAVLDWRLPDTTGTGPLPWLPATPATLSGHPTWGPYLSARSDLVASLTVDVRASVTDQRPAWLQPGQPTPAPELLAEVTLWRAANAVPDTDRRPTGPRQHNKAAAHWQHHLDTQLQPTQSPAVAEWWPLLDALAPALSHDPGLTQLADRLAAISRAGLNTPALVHAALAQGDLPDDHAAAALWWRISRDLSPTVAAQFTNQHQLAPGWGHQFSDHLGPDRAEQLMASQWWPTLVATIEQALAAGHPLEAITGMAGAFDPAVDLDECQALVWRLSVLTSPELGTETAGFEEPAGEELDLWRAPVDGLGLEAPTPAQWQELTATPALDDVAPDDVATELAAAALYRQSMGVLPPTDAQIERMVARAVAWDDACATPQRLVAINTMAMDFYASQVDTAWAGPYLDQRLPGWRDNPHITAGYAPKGWTTLVDHLGGRGVTDDELLEVGLATRSSTGRLIDRFRNRAVLPITHEGQILGFVGRRHPALTDNDDHAGPKYFNTPDTVLFHKGAQLYGVIPELLEHGATPVLVEGPFDALAITLAGQAQYVGVAPLGTALTDEQARQLATLHTSPVVATDADPAGRAAAERDFWLLTQHGTDPRTSDLPAGSDPAAVLTSAGPLGLRDRLDAAESLAHVLLLARLHVPHHQATLDDAAALIAAQPSSAWAHEAALVSDQLSAPHDRVDQVILARVQAWNKDPGAAATQANLTTKLRPSLVPSPPSGLWEQLAANVDSRLTSEPDWPALRSTLERIQAGGHDATQIVRQAVSHGPLDDAPARDLRYRLAALQPATPDYLDPPQAPRNFTDRELDNNSLREVRETQARAPRR